MMPAKDDPILALISGRSGFEFGDRVFFREARERINRPQQDWESRFVEVRYAGQHVRARAVLGLISRKDEAEYRWVA